MSYSASHPYDSSTGPKNSNPNHSMFTSQQQHPQPSLYQTTALDTPQSWPPYDETSLPPFHSQSFPYRGFPAPAPYTASRISLPSINPPGPSAPRPSMAGSFDPSTGIFCRMPEHPRLRTAQACEKCRLRKAKCSGEHPSCKRCLNRGLVCEYAKEGRVRGPNRAKSTSVSSSSKHTSVSATVDPDQLHGSSTTKNSVSSVEQSRPSSHTKDGGKTRGSEENPQNFLPTVPSETLRVSSTPRFDAMSVSQNTSSSGANTISHELYPLSVSTSLGGSPGLGGRRHSQPRPPSLGVKIINPWRQESTMNVEGNQVKWVDRSGIGLGPVGGIGAQGSQTQFSRQQLVEQHPGGYLLDEQQSHALQQHRSALPQQQNVPNHLEYQETQVPQQPLSYPAFPAQQQTSMHVGVDLHRSQYNSYPPMMARGYGNQAGMGYILSAMGHGRGYRIGPSGREVPDMGLLPSLSRRAREVTDGVTSEGLKEESISVGPPSSAVRDAGMAEGHGDQWA